MAVADAWTFHIWFSIDSDVTGSIGRLGYHETVICRPSNLPYILEQEMLKLAGRNPELVKVSIDTESVLGRRS